jgi:hypothetical protein
MALSSYELNKLTRHLATGNTVAGDELAVVRNDEHRAGTAGI